MGIINALGILFAMGVVFFAFTYHNPNPGMLVDPHGMIIVIGGTFACISVAYRLDRAGKMVLIFIKGFFNTRTPKRADIIRELMGFAEAYRTNSADLKQRVDAASDPFMKEALQALMDKVVDEKQLLRILYSRVNTIYELYIDESKMFAACGKYPPAMGLMGAVLGMIMLLASLGQPGAESRIGPSMAVALVATLYGIVFANLFVIPIGENLTESAKVIKQKNIIIVEGIRHIAQKVNPLVLAEELNSFLLPGERVDWKKDRA
ncbi:MAG: MotA/TolQ/ExbB proton channel family protein [Bdellovibrionota bacterium]